MVDQQLSIILLINFKQLFPAATLSIFSGSRCLHEVTKVDGERDRFQQSWKTLQSSHLIFRFVAVFCFSTKAGVKNSAKVNNGCKSNWSNHFSLFPSFFLLKIHQLAHTFLFLCRCRKCSGAVSLISDYWFEIWVLDPLQLIQQQSYKVHFAGYSSFLTAKNDNNA